MCGGSEVQCSAPSIIFLATRKTPSAPPGAQESLTEWPRFESGWASEIFRRTSTERGGAGHSRGEVSRRKTLPQAPKAGLLSATMFPIVWCIFGGMMVPSVLLTSCPLSLCSAALQYRTVCLSQRRVRAAEIRLRPFSPVALDTVVTIYLVMFTYT
jgi:hypothetical protein